MGDIAPHVGGAGAARQKTRSVSRWRRTLAAKLKVIEMRRSFA